MKPIDPKRLERLRQKRINEKEMLLILKDIVIYGIYLIFLLFLAQQNRNSKAFYINENLKNMFIDYDAESYEQWMKPADIVKYIKSTFLPNVYWTEMYNGEEIGYRDRPFMADGTSFRVGAIRLRQLRIKKNLCNVHEQMSGIDANCNVPYSVRKEDKGNYFPGWRNAGNATQAENSPWTYRTMNQLKGAPSVGRISAYNGGGFVTDLSGSYEKVVRTVNHLDKKNWFDKYTRAVFIELAVLNAYVNLFSRMSIIFEFSNTGLAFRSHQINTFQLYSYVGPEAVWIIFCEVVVGIFTIIFCKRLISKIKKEGRKYFSSFWNGMEFCKVVFSITAIVMYASKNAYVEYSLKDLSGRDGEFINFQRLAIFNETFIYLIGFVCYISIMEVLHLLRFNVQMSLMSRTLKSCTGELVTFSITFITTFLAFVQFAYIAFSTKMSCYKGFITAIESMLGHLLGDIDFVDMQNNYGWFGVIFYFIFIYVMIFIVMNMFFTIMGDAFSKTKEQLSQEKNQYEILDFILNLIKDLLGMSTVKEEEEEPIINYDEDDNNQDEVEELFDGALQISLDDSEKLWSDLPPMCHLENNIDNEHIQNTANNEYNKEYFAQHDEIKITPRRIASERILVSMGGGDILTPVLDPLTLRPTAALQKYQDMITASDAHYKASNKISKIKQENKLEQSGTDNMLPEEPPEPFAYQIPEALTEHAGIGVPELVIGSAPLEAPVPDQLTLYGAHQPKTLAKTKIPGKMAPKPGTCAQRLLGPGQGLLYMPSTPNVKLQDNSELDALADNTATQFTLLMSKLDKMESSINTLMTYEGINVNEDGENPLKLENNCVKEIQGNQISNTGIPIVVTDVDKEEIMSPELQSQTEETIKN